MFVPLHRYKFESNSQRSGRTSRTVCRCLCHYIDTSLKAIHNPIPLNTDAWVDVYAITFIQRFQRSTHRFLSDAAAKIRKKIVVTNF